MKRDHKLLPTFAGLMTLAAAAITAKGALVASFDIGTSTSDAAPPGTLGPAGSSTTWISGTTTLNDPTSGISVTAFDGVGFLNAGTTGFSDWEGRLVTGDYTYDTGDGGSGGFTVSGLTSTQIYDLYVLVPDGTGFGATNIYSTVYTIGSTSLTGTGATRTDTAWVEGQNYVVFRGLTGATSFTGMYADDPNTAVNNFGIAGFQVVAVPEPSAALLGALGVLGLLRRRR